MASDQVEAAYPASPDEVWAIVGDFGGIDRYFPGIRSVRREGDVRVVDMGGNEITERLIEVDEGARSLRYGIVAGLPATRHEATVTVHPDGEGSRVTWAFDVAPDELAPPMAATYARALEALHGQFA